MTEHYVFLCPLGRLDPRSHKNSFIELRASLINCWGKGFIPNSFRSRTLLFTNQLFEPFTHLNLFQTDPGGQLTEIENARLMSPYEVSRSIRRQCGLLYVSAGMELNKICAVLCTIVRNVIGTLMNAILAEWEGSPVPGAHIPMVCYLDCLATIAPTELTWEL